LALSSAQGVDFAAEIVALIISLVEVIARGRPPNKRLQPTRLSA
jgi:hypothetical protein